MTHSLIRMGAWLAVPLGVSIGLAVAAGPSPTGAPRTTVRPNAAKAAVRATKTAPSKAVTLKKDVAPKPAPKVVAKAAARTAHTPTGIPVVTGNIAPKIIEIEDGVDGDTVKQGTNLYPVGVNGGNLGPLVALFPNDGLYTFLNLNNPALNNTPVLNANGAPQLDWVKDSLVNSDPATIVNGVATGIITAPNTLDNDPTNDLQTGIAYQGQKRGHWNGARIVDGIATAEQDIFLKGGKEDDLSSWDNIGPGSVGSAKYDATQAFIANTTYSTTDTANFPSGRKNVLFFAMERRGNNGTTAFDFEFNQLQPLNDYKPNRSEGDVMFTFEMQGSATSGTAIPHVYKFTNGQYVEFNINSLPAAKRPIAQINRQTTPSAPWGYVDSKGNWVIGQIPKYSVAEAAVYFGDDVGFLTGIDACGGQAFVQIRTRSSVTENSDLKDTTKYFVYSFGGPAADLQLQSNCDQTFTYAGTGSTDSTGGSALTYNWKFQAPSGVTLSSTDSEFGPDPEAPNDATRYAASFTSDAARNVSVTLPAGANYADIDVQLEVVEGSHCEAVTSVHTVRVWRKLAATAAISVPCSDNYTVTFSANVTGGKAPLTYEWKFYKKGTTDTLVATASTASGSVQVGSAGTFYATLKVTDSADTSTDDRVIPKGTCNVTVQSNDDVTYDPIVIVASLTGSCDSRDIAYTSTVTGGKTPYTYEWKFYKKGTPDLEVATKTDGSGTFTPTEDGEYYAVLTVHDSHVTNDDPDGCHKTKTTNAVFAYGPMNPQATKTSADGTNMTVLLTATFNGPCDLQWQRYDETTAAWVNISSATSATLTYSAFETHDPTPASHTFTTDGSNFTGKLYSVQLRMKTSRNVNGLTCTATSDPVTVKKIIAVDP